MAKLSINANDAFTDALILTHEDLQRIGGGEPFPLATLRPGQAVELVNAYVAEPFVGTTATFEITDSSEPAEASLIAPVALNTPFNVLNTGGAFPPDAEISYFTKTANDAYIGGDQTGDPRGIGALDVQSTRFLATQVASGNGSVAVGSDNTASSFYSSAVGRSNTASGYNSSAVGRINTASDFAASAFGYINTASGGSSSAFGYGNSASGGNSSAFGYGNASSGSSSAFGYSNNASGGSSSAFGYSNTASGSRSSAFGYANNASGSHSSVFGYLVTNTVADVSEMGFWSNFTTRAGAIRSHPNGQIALTIEDSATAPTDGGATAGSEADGTLPRSMYSIQKNGTAVTLYYNNAGTIQSLSLGTLT